MDDDIRNRFRGVRPRGTSYNRPVRPIGRPAPRPAPAPVPAPVSPPRPQPAPERPQPTPAPARPATPPKPPKPKKRRRSKKGKLPKILKKRSVLVMLLVLVVLAIGYKFFHKKAAPEQAIDTPQTTQQQTPSTTQTPKPTGTIRMIAVGDNLAFDSVNSNAKQPDNSYNYLPMMENFKPYFAKADIKLCNESTPGGGDQNGLAISGYPTFNAPLSWSKGFADLGCNLINLASNHIADKGQAAIDGTLSTWEATQNILAVAGANKSAADQSKISYFTVKGVKFAYLAYTTSSATPPANPYSVNMYSDALADQQIAEARKKANLVIVSMNWGSEDSNDINADQDKIAQHLADANADVVIGGGPHALQPAKILNGKDKHQTLVWYSLGNFLNTELQVNNLIGGMAIMDFDAATGQLKDPKLMPVYMHYEWTPAQKAAGTVNARHDLKLYPLDLAAEALAKSLNGTTVQAQTERVTGIITKFAPIKVIKSTEF